MLLVDNRAGSSDLYPLLKRKGLPATLTRLDYGDVSMLGAGPDQEPVSIGVEVKSVRDLVNSVATGRFAGHQLPGLVSAYDQIWLLTIGAWRANAGTGLLEYRRKKGTWEPLTAGTRRFCYRDIISWLFTIQIKGGIRAAHVSNIDEAVIWLSALYSWWQGGWDNHKSHLAFMDGTRHGAPYKRDRATQMVGTLADKALLVRPTLTRMITAQLPGIGWTKSAPLAKRYRTVEELCMATPEEFEELEGIGPTLALSIYNSLRSVK